MLTEGEPIDRRLYHLYGWLPSQAGPGEILISTPAHAAAHLNLGDLEHRQMDPKGKSVPIDVRVLRVAPS